MIKRYLKITGIFLFAQFSFDGFAQKGSDFPGVIKEISLGIGVEIQPIVSLYNVLGRTSGPKKLTCDVKKMSGITKSGVDFIEERFRKKTTTIVGFEWEGTAVIEIFLLSLPQPINIEVMMQDSLSAIECLLQENFNLYEIYLPSLWGERWILGIGPLGKLYLFVVNIHSNDHLYHIHLIFDLMTQWYGSDWYEQLITSSRYNTFDEISDYAYTDFKNQLSVKNEPIPFSRKVAIVGGGNILDKVDIGNEIAGFSKWTIDEESMTVTYMFFDAKIKNVHLFNEKTNQTIRLSHIPDLPSDSKQTLFDVLLDLQYDDIIILNPMYVFQHCLLKSAFRNNVVGVDHVDFLIKDAQPINVPFTSKEFYTEKALFLLKSPLLIFAEKDKDLNMAGSCGVTYTALLDVSEKMSRINLSTTHVEQFFYFGLVQSANYLKIEQNPEFSREFIRYVRRKILHP